MIRFRTIDPTPPEKPAPQPALVRAVAAVQAEPVPEGAPPATRKGLVRKTSLRAKKKTEAAPLFDK